MRPQVSYREIVQPDTPISEEHKANVYCLLQKLNAIRFRSEIPMQITSGYRTAQKHRDIYIRKGVAEEKIPWGSYHLIGAAADIYDPNKTLQEWIKSNLDFIDRLDLYFESFVATPTWTHIQLFEPRSGNRFFLP